MNHNPYRLDGYCQPCSDKQIFVLLFFFPGVAMHCIRGSKNDTIYEPFWTEEKLLDRVIVNQCFHQVYEWCRIYVDGLYTIIQCSLILREPELIILQKGVELSNWCVVCSLQYIRNIMCCKLLCCCMSCRKEGSMGVCGFADDVECSM